MNADTDRGAGPLSFEQERAWLEDRLVPGPDAVTGAVVRLRGSLDGAALGAAITGLAARHPSLRTSFPLAGDTPVQVTAPIPEIPLGAVDASAACAPELAARALREPFDLARGPLLRARLIRTAEDDHLLVLAARQRIELDEIDTALAAHPAITQAVTALRHDLPGGDGLAAYLLPAPGATPPEPADLREHLAATLPGYMIPAAYIPLLSLPLSATGKVDRTKLPPPQPEHTIHAPYTPPATPHQHLIAAIYTDILGHPHISAHDNFFDLGGNSLQAARVATHIEERTGMELRVRDVFSTPVVSDLAALLDQLTEDAAAGGGDVDMLAAEVADLERQLEEARKLLAEQDGQDGGGS